MSTSDSDRGIDDGSADATLEMKMGLRVCESRYEFSVLGMEGKSNDERVSGDVGGAGVIGANVDVKFTFCERCRDVGHTQLESRVHFVDMIRGNMNLLDM